MVTTFSSLLKHTPHHTGTDQSAHGRKSYHLTDNPRFELDPTYVPDQNYLAIYTRKDAGIYLTDNPEYWVNAHDYVRPFVVEFEVTGEQEHAGVPGSSQEFIPADQFDRLKVTRVIPLDEWVREEFGEKGWVEEHFNPTEYSIYTPYKHPFPDYKYTGPDVREMTEEQTAEMARRTRQYLKEARGIDLEKRKINRTPDYPHGRSVKWPKVYRGLRRRGFSKQAAAAISNSMSNKYRGGSRQPLSHRAGQKSIPEDILDKRPDLRKHAQHNQDDHGNRHPSKASPFEDSSGTWHYVGHDANKPKRGREPTLCGLSTADMRRGADFPSGDPRSAVHFERGCRDCIDYIANVDLEKHMGPGPHPSGTPQTVHGSGAHGTSGTKMAERLSNTGDLREGFTMTPIGGEPVEGGFMVAIPGHELRIPRGTGHTAEAITAHRRNAWSAFEETPNSFWGGWADKKNNEIVLDVAVRFEDHAEAVAAGREWNQDAIFDLNNFEEIRTDDDGTSYEEWKKKFANE